MNRNRARQLVQAVLATLFAVAIAALSHGLGGDAIPSLLTFALTFAVALPIVALLQRLPAQLPRQILVIGVSQVVFHTLFWLNPGEGVVATATTTATTTASGSHHLTHLSVTVPDAATVAANGAAGNTEPVGHAMDMGFAGGMTAAHVIAGLLTLAIWRYGDALSRTVANTIVFALHRLSGLADVFVPVALRVEAPRRTARTEISATLRHRLLGAGLRHRGPPALVA